MNILVLIRELDKTPLEREIRNAYEHGEVISFCNLIGLKYQFEGYGYVEEFSIPENTEINLKEVLKVTLKAKEIKAPIKEEVEEQEDEDTN